MHLPRIFSLIAFAIVVGQFSGCLAFVKQTKAGLYIDNNTRESFVVEIDGEVQEQKVHSKRNSRYLVSFGEHKIVVKSEGKTLYSGTKLFEPSANNHARRNYLLDPTGEIDYSLYKITYVPKQELPKYKDKPKFEKIKDLACGKWIAVPDEADLFTAHLSVYTKTGKSEVCRKIVKRSRFHNPPR